MTLNLKSKKRLHGQGVLEYVLVVGIVVVALIAMTNVVKRGTQSLIRSGFAQIGAQVNADQSFSNKTGYLESQNSATADDNERQVVDRIGIINYIRTDQSNSFANALVNLGFTEEL